MHRLIISVFCFQLLICSSFGKFENDFEDQVDINTRAGERANADTLIVVHVLFRHGNRTAEPTELYPRDPYRNEKYFPFGIGQLTNAGKRREYSIGTSLRKRYHKFLGDHYTPDTVEAQSTDYNRTKMSLELALAGLFPPTGMTDWGGIPWQPTPYNFVKRSDDKVLLGVLCPYYLQLYDQERTSRKQQDEFRRYKRAFDYLTQNTGINVTSYLEIYNMFFGLATQEEWGFELPPWTDEMWPQPITDLATKEYNSAMATTEMRKMAVGYFFEKVIVDTRRVIRGDLKRKMFLYSAHESNVAELLLSLGLLDPPHIPTYGSYVIMEIHKINGVFGMKIFYENYTKDKIQQLKIPGCELFCPMRKFVRIINKYFPDEELCGNHDITNRFSGITYSYQHHLYL